MNFGPRERYCGDKIGYTHHKAATERNRLERKERMPMKIYQCPSCGRWHVAHLVPLKKPRDWRNDNP